MKRVNGSGLQGLIVAIIIHALGIAGIFLISPSERARASLRQPVKVRLVAKPALPKANLPKASLPASLPKAASVTKPIVVKPEKPLVKRALRKKAKPASTKQLASVTPSTAPAPLKKTTPRKFSVAMEASVPGGGVAVPVASGEGWSFGAPDGDPKAEKVLADPVPLVEEKKAPQALEVAGVTRIPRLVSTPTRADMRRAYPEEARRNREEADVYLKILISAKGRVSAVQVIKSAGAKFDKAAKTLVKRFRFQPGEVDGRPIAVWIPWTYKFRLEG